MLSFEKRFLGGSSLITKYRGQSEKFDDVKTGTPSVFQVQDMFCGHDNTLGCFDNFL